MSFDIKRRKGWNLQSFSEENLEYLKSMSSKNWKYICRYKELSEDFISKFQDRVDWKSISEYQILTENFIRLFQDRVDWCIISDNQKLSECDCNKCYCCCHDID